MTVSDPLLKDLKVWTRKLMECASTITDDNKNLVLFCTSLENCIEKGVVVRSNAFGLPKKAEAWQWLQNLSSKNKSSLYIFSSIVESVNENTKVTTSTGRLRLFIRTCLNRKHLHVPIKYIVKTSNIALEYYEDDSIIGNEILGEIFISVLLQINKLCFKLNTRNASFLDESWQLPECVALELVPCKTLGISVCFTRGKALIINVEDNSVAAEDNKVQVGDILDEINNKVINTYSRGKLKRIMKKSTGQPTALYILKHHDKHSGDVYGPIANIIKMSGIERLRELLKSPQQMIVGQSHIKTESNRCSHNSKLTLSAGFAVQYCGSVSTGSLGDVKQIERAMWHLLQSSRINKVPALFECLEIGIRVVRESDEAVIFRQSYMEISSCGRTANISNYFAFISGDTTCSAATKFEAHIFYHEDFDQVQLILQSIGQGFQRTLHAV